MNIYLQNKSITVIPLDYLRHYESKSASRITATFRYFLQDYGQI